MRDVVAGLLSAGLGAWIVLTARSFPTLGGGYQGPGIFPQLAGGLLALLGLMLAAAGLRGVRSLRLGLPALGAEWLQAGLVVAAVVLYLLAVPRLGFVLMTSGLLLLLMLAQGAPVRRGLPAALATVAIMHLLFVRLLRVPLPPGPWGW